MIMEVSYHNQWTFIWILLMVSLDGVDVVCPVSMTSCVCDMDKRGSKVKQITCTDVISHRQNGDVLLPRFSRSVKRSSLHNEVVEKLSFIYTGLTGIRGGAFVKIRIFHLDLQGNNFQDQISPKAFVGVGRYLRTLNMAWSNITKLNAKVFRGMVLLRNLSLAENKLQYLPGSIFQHLRSIRRLSLAGNHISQLPGTIFRYQTTLEVLDLGYCQLKRLPWTLLIGLWNLKVLDLRGNRLAYLEPYMFMDLGLLHTITGSQPDQTSTNRCLSWPFSSDCITIG